MRVATGAWADDGIVQKATRAIKREVRDLLVMGDVCLCEYMSHGHCGIVKQVPATAGSVATGSAAAGKAPEPEYEILNDPSLEILAKTAVSQARAGIDIIAPSDMMDGRVAAIRTALDANGFENIPILSLRRQVCLGILRTLPRSRRFGSGVRRPPLVPDGSRQLRAKPCARSNSTWPKART